MTKGVRIRTTFALGLVLITGAVALGARPMLDNVHAVVPGAVYRSAQLSPKRLANLIDADRVRAILNLRGARPGTEWYEAEIAVAAHFGVEHVDFELSAVREVPIPRAEELVALLQRLPKPLLIHCEAGADRSGLAAALYRYAAVGDAPIDAGHQLSALYGHLPIFGSGTAAMDRSFEEYVRAHPSSAKSKASATQGPQP
jgi:hypothetical protein